eukprot:NODE_735_length_1214_cov_362.351931_g589_i0.p1 GENE.NODE_735_length_1214_cov_362.351931_g589_i0~~NODE_735_length_1214_cov_362.351931_g589_i0.p1  ORF type:complete len:264 (+),score=50.02 NODE_735_length_1214_cov_362.351931_g589_i0:62-853(+)
MATSPSSPSSGASYPSSLLRMGPQTATPKGFQFSAEAAKSWLDSEFRAYCAQDMSTWKLKKDKDGRHIFKKDYKATGQEDTKMPLMWLRAVVPVSLDALYQFVHVRFIEESPKWTPTFKAGQILDRVQGPATGGLADEIVVNYVQHKLPLVNDRDFLYFTFVRFFNVPNPSYPTDPTPTRGIMFGNVSTLHPSFPPPKGFTRGEILKSTVVLQEIPGNPNACTYHWQQQLDIHGNIPKKLVSDDQADQMLKQHTALLKALGCP